jgi:hypothetical protein
LRSHAAQILLAVAFAWGAAAAPASAFNPAGQLCGAAGVAIGAVNPCTAVNHAGAALNVGGKLITGHVGSAVGTAAGAAASAVTSAALDGIGAWVADGAKFALDETAKVLGATTSPQLGSTWFSATYWRMAGIAAVLTLPFLFAAAVQALVRSDLGLLGRAAFMYLPLATLAVGIAAPLTMLLLAASDELSAIVASAAGNQSSHFLAAASQTVGDLTAASGSPFLAFLIGVFTVAGAVVLWIELLMREAAVYVIVLMLPLAFAAFVWPARRLWAVRSIELLAALILSKFAIVAVLSLGGAALGDSTGHHTVANWLAGLVLVVMAAFMPWALLRLVPLAEVASSAAGSLRNELRTLGGGPLALATSAARTGDEWVARLTAQMHREAEQAAVVDSGGGRSGAAAAAASTTAATGAAALPALAAAGENGRRADAGEPAPAGQAIPASDETSPLGALVEPAAHDGDAPASAAGAANGDPATANEAALAEEAASAEEGALAREARGDPSRDWKPRIMRAENDSLVLQTGPTAAIRPAATNGGRSAGQAKTADTAPGDDADLRPPAQPPPDGALSAPSEPR